MAVSEGFFKLIKRHEDLTKNIAQLNLLPGLAALAAVPAFMYGGHLILPIAIGITTAYLANNKNVEKRGIFAPAPLDTSYRKQTLEDAKVLDRIVMGMGMRLEDYKSGREFLSKKTSLKGTELHKAYHASRANDFMPIYLKDDYLTRHMTFIGATGVGKTEAQMSMLYQSVARGGGGIMIEMKGDGSLPARAYQIAKHFGAEKKFRLISLDNASISQKYNPLYNTTARSAIATIMSLLSANGEQFHKDVAKWGLNVAITVVTSQKSKPKYTLRDLFYLIGDIDLFYEYYEKMPSRTADEISAKLFARDFFVQFDNGFDKDGVTKLWNTRNYTERMMGVKAALQSFTTGDFAEVLCSIEPDLDLRRAIEEGEIVVLSANTLKDKEGVSTFARLFMADLAVAIGEIQSEGTKPLLPFPVWLDEYASFKHSFHQILFQLARSANVGLIIGIQGIGFLEDGNEGEVFARNVLGNCWNHVFFSIGDDKTRDLAISLAGSIINEMEQTSESESTGMSHDKSQGDIVGNISNAKSISTGTKQAREDQIQPEDLMLDAGDALWIGKYETYRTRLPYVSFAEDEPDLEKEYMDFEKFKNERATGLGLLEKMATRL